MQYFPLNCGGVEVDSKLKIHKYLIKYLVSIKYSYTLLLSTSAD